MCSFKRRLVKVRLHFLLTSSAFVLIFQRVRGEVASIAGSSGSSKAKFRPVPPPEVEVEDDPLPASPTFLSDGPESDVEPETSRGGRKAYWYLFASLSKMLEAYRPVFVSYVARSDCFHRIFMRHQHWGVLSSHSKLIEAELWAYMKK